MIDTILKILNSNQEDLTLILTSKVGDELTDVLCDTNEEFAQPMAEVIEVIDNNEVVQVTRLMNSNGDSTYFVFEVDEELIKNDDVIIEEDALDLINVDAIEAEIAVLTDGVSEIVEDLLDCSYREEEVINEAVIDVFELINSVENEEELIQNVDCILRGVYEAGYKGGISTIKHRIEDLF